jgi:hypothetical protein
VKPRQRTPFMPNGSLASLIATILIYVVVAHLLTLFHTQRVITYRSYSITIDLGCVARVRTDGCNCNDDLEVGAGRATSFFIFTLSKHVDLDKRSGRKK